jgi:hypothetical protein
LTRRLAACFRDRRNQELIEHRVETLMVQRVFGIALGYEDLNDHDKLRQTRCCHSAAAPGALPACP